MKKDASINGLKYEAWFKVFDYMDIKDFTQTSLVCKDLKKITENYTV